MINLINISKNFHTKKNTVVALDNVNLHIEKGDIFGIIGYSGAGKSTLVRCINFLEVPSQGTVQIKGVDLSSLSQKELRKQRKNIGMIFQHFNLMNNINVFDNIAAPLKRDGMSETQINERVNSLLKLVGLEEKSAAFPRQLSGGQKQRVAIARALSNNPEILLCDEATSALDPNTTKSILYLLKKIHKNTGITIVVITHQMEVVKQICNKVAVMESGKVVEEGSLIDIFANPQNNITKAFVSQTMHGDEFLEKMKDEKQTIYKLSFLGNTTHSPLISDVIQKYYISINILFGNIEKISNSMVGNLYVELFGDSEKIKQAIDYIKQTGTRIEVISHD